MAAAVLRDRLRQAIAFRAGARHRRDRRTGWCTARATSCRRSWSTGTGTTWWSRRSRRGWTGCCRGDGGARRVAGAPRDPGAQRPEGAHSSRGWSSRCALLHGEVPGAGRGSRRRRCAPRPTCGTGRRPGCSWTSARTGKPRRATRTAGRSTASATTAGSRCGWRGACTSVLALDASEPAVARIRENAALNGAANVEARVGNVFDECASSSGPASAFDTIVLDPPAFAKSRPARRQGAVGLQGDQPAGAEAPARRRHARHVFLLVPRRRSDVRPGDPRGRVRRARGRDGGREADAGPRSPRPAGRAGDVLPEVLRPAAGGVGRAGPPQFPRSSAGPRHRAPVRLNSRRVATTMPLSKRATQAEQGGSRAELGPAGVRLHRQPHPAHEDGGEQSRRRAFPGRGGCPRHWPGSTPCPMAAANKVMAATLPTP